MRDFERETFFFSAQQRRPLPLPPILCSSDSYDSSESGLSCSSNSSAKFIPFLAVGAAAPSPLLGVTPFCELHP